MSHPVENRIDAESRDAVSPAMEEPVQSRGSTVHSSVSHLPPMDSFPLSARSAQAPSMQQSEQGLSLGSRSVQTLDSEQDSPTEDPHRIPSTEGSSYSSSPVGLSSSSPDSQVHDLGVTTDHEQRVQECLWIIGSFLGLQLDSIAIFEDVEMLNSGAGEVELCANGKAKGIYIVESGELEIMVEEGGGGGGVVIDVLKQGDFCGELSALFCVPQFIKAKSLNGYLINTTRISIIAHCVISVLILVLSCC